MGLKRDPKRTGCIHDRLGFGCGQYCFSAQIQSRTALTSSRAAKRELIKCSLLYLCILISLVNSQSIKLRARTNCHHHQPSSSSHESHNENNNNNNNNNQAPLSKPHDYEQFKQKPTPETLPASQAKPCNDCLAIPLLAIVGNKQLSGFLIPPPQTRPKPNPNPTRQYQSAYEAQQRGHHYEQADYEPASISQLEPHSDDKCPMVGPLTVCDQIDSYPADIILNKLNNAKKVLKQTYFNIDSLFSDEREHSSEPFDEQTVKVHNNKGSAQLQMNSSSPADRTKAMIVGSGYEEVDVNRARNYNKQDPRWHRMDSFLGGERRQNRDADDDFVRLVEQQGISISEKRPNEEEAPPAISATDSNLASKILAPEERENYEPREELSAASSQFKSRSGSGSNQRRSSKSRVSKRQVSVQVSSGRPDPESAASDEQTSPTPICRAKSIYISPRAAVSSSQTDRRINKTAVYSMSTLMIPLDTHLLL